MQAMRTRCMCRCHDSAGDDGEGPVEEWHVLNALHGGGLHQEHLGGTSSCRLNPFASHVPGAWEAPALSGTCLLIAAAA